MPEAFTLVPLRALDLPSMNAHVRTLNRHLHRIADLFDGQSRRGKLTGDLDAGSFRLTNLGTAVASDDALTLGQLSDALDELETKDAADESSENAEEGAGGGTGKGGGRRRRLEKRSSEYRRIVDDEIRQALVDSIPGVAPPKVDNANVLGTTVDPPLFALSDHTHQGVNLDAAQTITGVKTFNADVLLANGGSIFQLSTNRLGVGTIVPVFGVDVQGFNINAATLSTQVIGIGGSVTCRFRCASARDNGSGGPIALNLNDLVGTYQFLGHDGAAFSLVAEMRAVCGETFTGTNHGTRFQYRTAILGTTAVAERMRIDANGNLIVGIALDFPLTGGSAIVAGYIETGAVFATPTTAQSYIVATGKYAAFLDSQKLTSTARAMVQGTGRLYGVDRIKSISDRRNPGSMTLANKTSRFFDRRNTYEGPARVRLVGDARLRGLGLNAA